MPTLIRYVGVCVCFLFGILELSKLIEKYAVITDSQVAVVVVAVAVLFTWITSQPDKRHKMHSQGRVLFDNLT